MLLPRSLCFVWAFFLLAQEAFSYSIQEICAKRCMYGRGGILCHCNAMHFTGKRNGDFHKENRLRIRPSNYLSLLDNKGDNSHSDYSRQNQWAESSNAKGVWKKLSNLPFGVETHLDNEDIDNLKRMNYFVNSESLSEKEPVSLETEYPQSSIQSLDRVLGVKWPADNNGEPNLRQSGGLSAEEELEIAKSSQENSDDDKGDNDEADEEEVENDTDEKDDERAATQDGVAKVIGDMINRLDIFNRESSQRMMQHFDTDTPSTDNDADNGDDDENDNERHRKGRRVVKLGGRIVSLRSINQHMNKNSLHHQMNGHRPRLARLFTSPRALLKRHPVLIGILKRRHV